MFSSSDLILNVYKRCKDLLKLLRETKHCGSVKLNIDANQNLYTVTVKT